MSPDSISEPTFERIDGDRRRGLLFLCDHASNRVPADLGDLGLPPAAFARHIAYDIGAEGVTRRLAKRAGAPMLRTTFSRLVLDPNRGADDPTLVMRLSDGAIVPGNARIDRSGREARKARFHAPYHAAIAAEIDAMLALGVVPAIVSIHSFTPVWKGVPRPWEVGILWDSDDRLNRPLIDALRSVGDLNVGDNQPYDGALRGDTLYTHATRRGLAHTLIEVRQDLIADDAGMAHWADRLWTALAPLVDLPHMHEIRHFGSRSGPVRPWPTPATASGDQPS